MQGKLVILVSGIDIGAIGYQPTDYMLTARLGCRVDGCISIESPDGRICQVFSEGTQLSQYPCEQLPRTVQSVHGCQLY